MPVPGRECGTPAEEGAELRQLGNAAFHEGRFQDAFDLYTDALKRRPDDDKLFCNRSATCLHLGAPQQALRDAIYAEQLLRIQPGNVDAAWLRALAKACFLQGSATLQLGNTRAACICLRMTLKLVPSHEKALQALEATVAQFTNAELATLAATMISAGQQPSAFSTRDGTLMKRLPEGSRFTFRGLVQHLQDALVGSEDVARHALLAYLAAVADGLHSRHLLHAFRSMALMQAKSASLALKDARAAIAFMPKTGCALALVVHAAALMEMAAEQADGTTDLQLGRASVLVPFRTAAAVSLLRASRIVTASAKCADDLSRCLLQLPETHAKLLAEHGIDALLERIRQQHEAAQPEFKRPKPKYAAYFAWMAQRIAERFPDIEDAARDKLLCMDSGELDLLLQPQNAHLDVAALVEAAEHGISWKTFSALGHSAPTLLGST